MCGLRRLGFALYAVVLADALLAVPAAQAEPLVPGTGKLQPKVGDDFEDEKWAYDYALPKSSNENDQQTRLPGGRSKNGRWFESALRGQPDLIKRVDTPEGGIPGSKGAMLMRSLSTGVPGRPSRQNQQDDLLADVGSKIGATSVALSPSVVVRVYLPPWEEWEQRSGNTFGFRAGLRAYTYKKNDKGRRSSGGMSLEPYWPGMFIYYCCKNDPRYKTDSALLTIRGDQLGHDFYGPRITEPGWWTLGMSFTPDGMVHFYGHAGVEPLTAQDLLASKYPYGFKCETFQTFFFDIISPDDGKSWSTPWIVDDPMVYIKGR